MILVEGVSDCLEMERGSPSINYVASRNLHPINYSKTGNSLAAA
jgi:hypothetical protein